MEATACGGHTQSARSKQRKDAAPSPLGFGKRRANAFYKYAVRLAVCGGIATVRSDNANECGMRSVNMRTRCIIVHVYWEHYSNEL